MYINTSREITNIMFIDALRSIAPHRAKKYIVRNRYNIEQTAKQQFTKTAKLAKLENHNNYKITKL